MDGIKLVRLEDSRGHLQAFRDAFDRLRTEEDAAHRRRPNKLRASEAGEIADAAIASLTDIVAKLDAAIEAVSEVIRRVPSKGATTETTYFERKSWSHALPQELVATLKKRSSQLLASNPGLEDGMMIKQATCPSCGTTDVGLTCINGEVIMCHPCYWRIW